MALNIDIVNSTVINVYETGGVPRSYFGAVGASGKFYPSGTTSTVINSILGSPSNLPGFRLISNTLQDLVDGSYFTIQTTSTFVNPSFTIQVLVVDGVIADPNGLSVNPVNISGYSIGDLVTFEGADLGGTGSITFEVTQLEIDGLLIVIGGDDYYTKWQNLVIGGTSPESLSDAQSLLANLFSTL